jgi:hypothetical protein
MRIVANTYSSGCFRMGGNEQAGFSVLFRALSSLYDSTTWHHPNLFGDRRIGY